VSYLVAVPANGKDYRTGKAVREDWDAGAEFRVKDVSAGAEDGQIITKTQLPGDVHLTIRYDRARSTVRIC
jgi:hypothetical protein